MLKYRFITGPNDAEFCKRVSDLLENGYVPYGAPTLIVYLGQLVCGQAVVFVGENNETND